MNTHLNLDEYGSGFLNTTNGGKSSSKSWADKLANGAQGSKQRTNGSNSGWNGTESMDSYGSYSDNFGHGQHSKSQSHSHSQSHTDIDDFINGDGRIKMIDVNTISEDEARKRLPIMLNAYILSKCNANEHCRKSDFDGTAREALQRISFLQALQAIEHFATSVSTRIQKRPAYLMGILRGQEGHWDKSRAAAQLEGGSAELLALPPRVLLQIAQLCLDGNCLPSDFTPEVCLALHRLTEQLCLKALHAFNSNKRIVAGCKGGVLNRARFFQRLIQNVAEQNASLISPPVGRSGSNASEESGGNSNYYEQQSTSPPTDGGQSPQSPKQESKLPEKFPKSGRSIKRAVSLSISMEDSSAAVGGQTSPNQNAWNSPLASSTLVTNSSWSVPNAQTTTPPRSMSMDNSHFQHPWGQDSPAEHAFQAPASGQDARSISSLSVQTSDSHSNAVGPASCPPTPREGKLIGSPVQAVQRGWESPMARHNSAQSQGSQQLLSQSLVNGSVMGWNGGASPPNGRGHQGMSMPRSNSISEGQDMWKQGGDMSEYGVAGKQFTSLFTPGTQQRSSTPTSQTSNSPRNHKQKQLQPQDEEPDTLSENTMIGSLELSQVRAMAPEERADVLESELIKQNKKLKAYAKGESNLLGELIQAKNRVRTLESQLAKLSSEYHALSSSLRQEVMVAVAQSFDRAAQRSRMSVNTGSPEEQDMQQQQQQHPHYK